MTWKVVNIADTGTSIKFGADDLDKVSNLLNGSDIDSVKLPVDYIDFNLIAEPASPSSGYLRVYMDSADNRLKVKDSSGEVVVI
jgi:hypothetical protein